MAKAVIITPVRLFGITKHRRCVLATLWALYSITGTPFNAEVLWVTEQNLAE
jgi:hypothetical protein